MTSTPPKCPQCGEEVERVRRAATSPLNEDQFDSCKAGDFFCKACPSNGRGNAPFCYWWEREVVKAPLPPSELEQPREALTKSEPIFRLLHHAIDSDKAEWIVFIAELDGEPVGSATLNGVRDDIPYVTWFAVLPEYQRRGIGRQQMNAIIEWCRRMGKSGINLWVNEKNLAAIHLYKSAGFVMCRSRSSGENQEMMFLSLQAKTPQAGGGA